MRHKQILALKNNQLKSGNIYDPKCLGAFSNDDRNIASQYKVGLKYLNLLPNLTASGPSLKTKCLLKQSLDARILPYPKLSTSFKASNQYPSLYELRTEEIGQTGKGLTLVI